MIFKKWWVWIIVIVILAGAVVGGKYLMDQKKERDRQALIHMGDDLKKAWSDYEDSTTEINSNHDLAMEYTDLMKEVLDGNTDEEFVAKVCKMEKELMEIYPDIYTEPSPFCTNN